MAEVKKKQEEGSFGSGLLGGLKQIGSDLMDFLQTPEAFQFGRGILNSKSPGIMGAIGDGYQAYQDAKQTNLDNAFKRQMLQLDAALKVGKALEMQSKIGARNDHKSALNARDMGMGGGTPSSGRGAPTLADYQNANLKFLEAPSGSTKQSSGGNEGFVAPPGMSIEQQIKEGYPVNISDEEALAADQKKLQIPSQPTTPGQAGGYQQQAGFAPQAQDSREQYLRKMAAQGYIDEGNFGKAWEIMMGDKPNLEILEGRHPDTGQLVLYEYNKNTGQRRILTDVIPTTRDIDNRELTKVTDRNNQLVYRAWNKDKNRWEEVGGESFRPESTAEGSKYFQDIQKAATGRYTEYMKDLEHTANTTGELAGKSQTALDLMDQYPNIRSGPGTATGTEIRNLFGLSADAGEQELFEKVLNQLIPQAAGNLRESGVKMVTQTELMHLIPTLTGTLKNSPQGLRAILGLSVAVNDTIQKAHQRATELDRGWREKYEKTGRAPFNLEESIEKIRVLTQEKVREASKKFISSLGGVKK